MTRFAAAGLFALLAGLPAHARAQTALQEDQMSAVLFVYHGIGDDDANSVSRDQFEDHIRELKDGGYNILPLPQIVDALKAKKNLPNHTVAITFDGGSKSIASYAAPLLLKQNIPFTVFIAPAQIDQNVPDYMSWADVKSLAHNKLVTIGLHPNDYKRLSGNKDAEIEREVNAAMSRMRDMLKIEPQFFAYPFGEYSLAYRNIIEKDGFAAAFGQQSGVAWPGADLFTLPRFSITDGYADLDRFRMTADALPLPVTDISPADPKLGTDKPDIGFTVDARLKDQIGSLSCFVSDQPAPIIHTVGSTRVEIRLKQPIGEDKTRLNCTLPAPAVEGDDTPHWRWFGMMMISGSES